LDDEFFVSVSKDNMVAMWQIQDHNETDSDFGRPIVKDVNSTVAKKCKAAKKLRSVTFNKSLKEIITLSLNGYVHTWDVESFKQVIVNFMYIKKICVIIVIVISYYHV